MNPPRKLSRGLTMRRYRCAPIIGDKIIALDNLNIKSINSNKINSDLLRVNTANIGKMGISYDTDTKTSIIKIPENLVIETDDNKIINTNNNGITVKNVNITDTLNSTDGKFIGNIEATNLSLLGDIASTNSHITNQLNVDGNIIGNNISTTNLSSNNISATCATINKNITAETIKIVGITETPQVSSQTNLVLSVGPDCTINVPNIRYNIDLNNNTVIGPAEIKLSKIFIASGDIRLVGDSTCDGIEVIIFNNTIANIRVSGPQFITTISQKTIKKFLFLALISKWCCY